MKFQREDISWQEFRSKYVEIGGDALISVQSMTDTLTTDIKGTVKQIKDLEEAGADIVRVSCPDQESNTKN